MNDKIGLKVNDMTIRNQTETKFLGMWLDQSLNWHSHIQKLTLKIKRNKYLLNKGKHLMDHNTHTLQAIYSMVCYCGVIMLVRNS